MITFTQLGTLGRLGNQLFQYAASRGIAAHRGYELKIPDPATQKWHGQECLLARFNLECSYMTPEDYATVQHHYAEPDYMKFDPNVFSFPDNVDLHGFFQSTYYFDHCSEQIKRELTPKAEYAEKAQETMAKLKEAYPDYEIVSLHLRRGDNTDGSNPSSTLNNMYGAGNKFELNSFYGRFFSQAMIHFWQRKTKFLVFTGGSRADGNSNTPDIEWCKEAFVGEQYLFSEGHDSFEDFCLIMQCDHNIISPVSSFGWWAAYLNQNPNRQVLAPRIYDPTQTSVEYREGFYPGGWNIL